LLTFAGAELDRASTLREDSDWVAARLADATSRALAAGAEGVLLADTFPPRLLRGPLAAGSGPEPQEAILLGLEHGTALFARDLDALDTPTRARVTHGGRVASLREAGALLSRSEGGLAAYLAALLHWHRAHRFCADCGAPTVVEHAGASRRCTRYGTQHFPRTDPAVIVAVENAGRLLLGRRPGWPRRQYSVLAGFVAPGESLEEAVAREVHEESGILICRPVFVASQPWPFPASLMLGFEAESDGGEPVTRDQELEDVRWFERETVGRALRGCAETLVVPPGISIARFLIERWWRGSGPPRSADGS
jgi:NAD+ diphosphatase